MVLDELLVFGMEIAKVPFTLVSACETRILRDTRSTSCHLRVHISPCLIPVMSARRTAVENGSATLPSVWLSCRTLAASREFIGFVGLLGASTRSKGFDGMSPSLRALMKAVFNSTWVCETVFPP